MNTDAVDVRDLRVFTAVAACGSFSAAARELGTTQPSVSRAVARLEAAVGVPLVVRTTRRLSLTDAGTVLLREARQALDQLAAAVTLARRAARGPGRLTVAVKPDGDAGLLATALPGLEALLGDRVDLVLAETPELAPAVRTGRADACLVAGPVDLTGLDHDLVLSEPRLAVLPAAHRFAGRDRLERAELDGEPVVRWPRLPRPLDRFYQGLVGDEPPRTVPAPDAGDLAEALRLVELGRGVTFLPVSVVRRFAARAVRTVAVGGLPPSELRLAWRAVSRDPAVSRLIDHIHATAAS
ncbi:LysR family transcriptional regulator [Streptomyces sp. NPDC021224]|uniref:LysR family transcriptional regulator n=1 Tax=unclassified Streptomyces TaxID=2593676 RepID=UPI0037BB5F54